MDSHGRRYSGPDGPDRSGDIDPADQWVFDPDTGSYQLRLVQDDRPGTGTSDRTTGTTGGTAEAGAPTASPGRSRRVPEQRRAAEQPPSGGRRAARAAAGRGRRPAPEQERGTGRRKAKAGRKKALHWTAGGLGFLLVAGCGGGYYAYQHFNGNLNTVDVDLGGDRPAGADGPMNILVIGTDSRQGLGKKYGDEGSVGHADTTLLFHVSEDRTNATVLSIPRDMLVDVPDCSTKQADGSAVSIPGTQQVRFNTSLGQGGRDPGCTWKTVEELTGIRVDHFMLVDFNAVKTLSTAIGGVEVCVAKDINDSKSKLNLTAGRHVVQGEDALAFVRTRYSVGMGSDLSRIELQQQFVGSMVRKMKSGDTLTDPKKLYRLADAATKALTVDSGIGSVAKLTSLAQDLSQVNTKNITFATVPVVDSADGATVELNEAKAKPLFAMIRADRSLTEVKKKDKSKGKSAPKPTETSKADPSEVRVTVVNGGGPVGAAQDTVAWLQNDQGVALSSNGGNAGATQAGTTLEYAPGQGDQARTLAEMMGLPDSALKETGSAAAEDEPMTLTLGKDYEGAGTPIAAPTKAPEGVQSVNGGDENVCAK
ncbi:LytR family transcriptional regulator [Streptomyces sp. SCUT-3]|nr:LytR family transcriptional regulator [Streptomyces sp. SCUT-3]